MKERFFQVGKNYTREEITRVLGGTKAVLSVADGKVVAACVDPTSNALTHLNGEVEIFLRKGKAGLDAAKLVKEQNEEVPLFLKLASTAWRYAGLYKFKSLSQKDKDVHEALDESGRTDIDAVLTLAASDAQKKSEQ